MGRINAVVSAAVLASAVVAAPLAPSYAGSEAGGSTLDALGAVTGHATAAPRSAPAAQTLATTGPGVPLGLSGFSDIVADPVHHHVFVSGGPGSAGVVVTDQSGAVLQTLTSTSGAGGMVLSPDGATLYVALPSGDGIREVDTATLTGTTVSTGTSTCPQDLAVTAGTVWFSYECAGDASGRVGALDPSTGDVHLAVVADLVSAPYLAASPGLPGALFTGSPHASPVTITRFDVTGGATPTATSVASVAAGDNLGDLTVTPDGADVIVASGAPYYHQVFKTSDLSADGKYPTDAYPNSVAVNEGGLVAAGLGSNLRAVWLFAPAASTPTKTWTFASGDYLQPRGLAFTGQTVYAVTGDVGGPLSLHVLSTKPYAPMTVSTDRSTYHYGAKAHVTIHLTTPDTDRAVSIYATPAGGSRTLVKSGTLSGGTFSAAYVVRKLTTFTAVYAGGATYDRTSRTRTVKVHARVVTKVIGSYGRRHGYALFHVSRNPKWLGTVSPNHSGECVDFVAQHPTRSGGWRTFGSTGCVALSSTSQAGAVLRGTHVVGERVRLKLVYGGDAVSLKQVSAWSYVRFTR